MSAEVNKTVTGLERLTIVREVIGGKVPDGVSPDLVIEIMRGRAPATEGVKALTRRERRELKRPFRMAR